MRRPQIATGAANDAPPELSLFSLMYCPTTGVDQLVVASNEMNGADAAMGDAADDNPGDDAGVKQPTYFS